MLSLHIHGDGGGQFVNVGGACGLVAHHFEQGPRKRFAEGRQAKVLWKIRFT